MGTERAGLRETREEAGTALKAGDAAPDFTLLDDAGDEVRLSALRGRPVVLFFYPADGTPFCTVEACEFRDRFEEFEAAGAAVFGVSRDTMATHAAWRKEKRLPFPLLADEDGTVAAIYHAVGLFGHPKRATYVVDAGGKLALAYESHLRPKAHAEKALAAVKALK